VKTGRQFGVQASVSRDTSRVSLSYLALRTIEGLEDAAYHLAAGRQSIRHSERRY
jgi:hypothetical protein